MNCGCCGKPMKTIGTHQTYSHHGCGVCGFQHFSRDATISKELYELDADYIADLAISSDYRSLLQWAHQEALRGLKRHLSRPFTLLDVGCFNGFFVRHAVENGVDAKGIDFNSVAICFGVEKYDLSGRISTETLQDVAARGEEFDAISLFEVIEHLPEFRTVLRDLVVALKPGGLLVLSTPNSLMSWRPPLDFPPHHLSRFSPRSLRALCESLELDVLELREQMSLFDLVRNFVGIRFRSAGENSLRGGAFKVRSGANWLRRGANRMRWSIYILLKPIDAMLKALGFRYISQVVIARKKAAVTT